MIKESREFKTSGIYSIRNKCNNKIYIGSSKNIHSRISEHILDLNKDIHQNDYLQRSWNKYGEVNFELMIIELCEFDILLDREQYWMDFLKSYNRKYGYNLQKDAKRHYVSEETRKKMSIKFSGKNNPRHGVKGCTRNAEQLKGHAKSCSKPVIQFDKNGKKICNYKSLKEAAEANGINASGISSCLKGNAKTCGGYTWKYDVKFKKQHKKYDSKKPIKYILEQRYKKVFQEIKKSPKDFSRSEKTRKKISESLKGNIPWNKGKKMSKEYCEKISFSQKKRIPWNKGKKMSEEYCENISKAKKGKPSPKKGKPLSREHRLKISEAQKERHERERAKQE